MTAFLRLALGLGGVLFVLIGLAFLIEPARMAAQFFLSPIGSQGLATLRADFPGFFITGGLFALVGAWRKDSQALNVPLLLLAIALLGRTVSLVIDGRGPDAIPPMVVEALFIALIVAAQRAFARR
jgi:hypothetical protein